MSNTNVFGTVVSPIDFSVKLVVFVFQFWSQKQSANILLLERIMAYFQE
ncbi:hypothetical protein HDEF_1380 [Candidatus Hamiltonella defensa 5AT (Acyrthosiphon pisum)]|uniref:Uncharacterized protein n=1 Tax=Hamiltonella defensa subsp. Acyrthosiphon pisum (strain 5AT) TaxID=572265 RepID=C4K622_HAMD5|nr:hypothetical protein HDEF_1380 [Candidatus Hamiltonella defensa 5AT (Acyrthosiphon pisum)]